MFYRNTQKIDILKSLKTPTFQEWSLLESLFNSDNIYERYFFESDKRFNILLPSPGWAKILYENHIFDDLNNAPEDIKYLQKIKASYLAEIAKENSKDVWEIITKLSSKEQIIQSRFLEAIAQFEGELPKDCIELTCQYLKSNDSLIWVWIGEPAAKIMVRTADVDIDGALKIAAILFEIREYKMTVLHDTRAKLDKHSFDEFISNYFKTIWEKYPFKTIELLLTILDEYLKSKEDYSEQKDNSAGLNISYSDLSEIKKQKRGFNDDILLSLIDTICEVAGYLAKNGQRSDMVKFMALLDNHRDSIYIRIKLFALKYTNKNDFKDDILATLTKENFDNYSVRNEFDLLLCNTAEILKDTPILSHYLEWVETSGSADTVYFRDMLKQHGETDIDEKVKRYVSRQKAKRLYRLKDNDYFKEKYLQYRAGAELTDDDLKPRPTIEIGEGTWIAPDENTPFSVEELRKKSIPDIFNILKNPDNYSEDKSKSQFPWHTPREGLKGAFKEIIKERCSEFLNLDVNVLFEIPLDFLRTFFGGLSDGISENKSKSFDWMMYFNLANNVLQKLGHDTICDESDDRYGIYLSIIRTTGNSWSNSHLAVELSKKTILEIVNIIRYSLEVCEIRKLEGSDLVQLSCNRVTSLAFESCIDLAIAITKEIKAKKNIDYEYKDFYLPIFVDICNLIIKGNYPPFTLCLFGKMLPGLFCTNEAWIRENIVELTNGDNWQNIWETYLVWARPYIPLFEFLVETGLYQQSIKLLSDKSEKIEGDGEGKPSIHLGRHLVIAYFNGWLEASVDILHLFYDVAPVKLRIQTNKFFATGFPRKDGDSPIDANTLQRIESHWRYRLDYFKTSPESNDVVEEATEFLEWIRYCPLAPEIALDLMSKTLDFTKGRASREGSHDIVEFIIEGICNKAEGNELLALECLLKFSLDPRLGAYSTTYQEGKIFSLFIKKIKDLDDAYIDIEEIRKKACDLLDNYGRMGIYNTKQDYFELSSKVKP
jgi:hypothetical protein